MKEEEHIEKIIQAAATLIAVMTFAGMIFVLAFHEIPPKNENTLNLIIGALIGIAGGIYGYWYGSSKGGRENREQLNKLMDNTYPPGAAVESKTVITSTKEADKP